MICTNGLRFLRTQRFLRLRFQQLKENTRKRQIRIRSPLAAINSFKIKDLKIRCTSLNAPGPAMNRGQGLIPEPILVGNLDNLSFSTKVIPQIILSSPRSTRCEDGRGVPRPKPRQNVRRGPVSLKERRPTIGVKSTYSAPMLSIFRVNYPVVDS
jgi:hypothetical protein